MRRAWLGGLAIAALAALLALGLLAHLGSRVAVALLTPATLKALLAETQRPPPGDPLAALGLPFETWAIETELGPAPALWIPAEPPAGARPLAAVVVHGIGGRPEDGYDLLPALHAAGVPTLLVSYRNDEGAPAALRGFYGFGLTEWRDLEAAVRRMRAEGHDRLLLAGASMGGAVVGQFMARSPEASAVAGLAFDSAAFEGRATLAHLLARAGLPLPGLAAALAILVTRWRTGTDLGDGSVAATVAAFSGPVFVTQGTADTVVPAALADRLVARRAGAPTVYVRTARDHLGNWRDDPGLLGPAFQGFLDGLLAAP